MPKHSSGPKQDQHATVRLVHPSGDFFADIDEAMAPLIAAMWSIGWTTFNCCEGNPDASINTLAYIQMNTESLGEFLTAVANSARDDVAKAALEAGPDFWRGELKNPDKWYLEVGTMNLSEDAAPEIMVTVAARFPQAHLGEVTKAVERMVFLSEP